MGQFFELLPLEERIQQYREMADATFIKANRTDNPILRDEYMTMAINWHTLAQQLEAGIPDPELSPTVVRAKYKDSEPPPPD